MTQGAIRTTAGPPIALLNITYKPLAKIIQTRLRPHLEAALVKQQFGFRLAGAQWMRYF